MPRKRFDLQLLSTGFPPRQQLKTIAYGGCFCARWEEICGLNALLAFLLVLLTFRHNGRTKSAAQIVGQFVKFGVAVDLDGLFGGVTYYIAVVAPSQVVFEFGLGAIIQSAVQIVGELLQEFRTFHFWPSPLSRF